MFARGLCRPALVLTLVLALTAPFASPRVVPAAQSPDADAPVGEVRPGELLVQPRSGSVVGSLARRAGATVGANLGGGVRVLRVAVGEERARAAQLRADPDVTAAAPNYVRRALAQPDDPFFPTQWALARIRAPEAWDATPGDPGVKIAILDSGADLSHPDLIEKLLPGTNTLGADPPPTGTMPTCAPNDTPRDDYDQGHGTHVSGIAAAATSNGLGVAGVAWRPMVLPVKVLDCRGEGSDAQVIAGIDWAIQAGTRVINLSVGGPGQSDVLDAAVKRAFDAGILVVAASGNAATSVPFYPAASPHAMAVGATGQDDRLLSFSNIGSHISVTAPGSSIVSTFPGGAYQLKSGTSMASPHVAGLAALIASRYPGHGPARIRGLIQASARQIDHCPSGAFDCTYDRNGHNAYYGYGRIDAAQALRLAQAAVIPLIGRGTLS